jgi:phosphoribosyl 1,2-cyclic phosphodiesterase
LRVHLLGVRGSTPATGHQFVRYGGNTSCVALARDGEPPSLVLDAGTGIRRLAGILGGDPFRGTLLLGHLHWDHTQGLPFSRAVDHDCGRVHVLLPDQHDGDAAVDVLRRAMSPPHFPIEPEGLRGMWSFDLLADGVHDVEGWRVEAREIPHKGGRTLGYRVSDGRASIAYLSDHGPSALGPGPDGHGPYHSAAMALADGVDLLLHDAQHTAEELPSRALFGHSSAEYAVALGERAEARAVQLFHHDPDRTDDEVDALVRRFAGSRVAVAAAAEDATIHLPSARR